MSDEQPERRGPGRPRIFVEPSELTIRLDASMHDAILKEGQRLGIESASAAARALLAWALQHRRATRTT